MSLSIDGTIVQLWYQALNITLDTSAIIAVITNEPHRDRLIEASRDADLLAPSSVHWEIGNAFSAMFKQQRITEEQAQAAVSAYARIPIQLVDVSLDAALGLARELDIYAYDAYVLRCALQYRYPVLTLDAGLRAAAFDAGANVVELAP